MFASVHSDDHKGAENGGQDTHGSFRPQLHPSSVAPPLLPQWLPNSFLSCFPTPSSAAPPPKLLPQLLPNSFLNCSSSPIPSSAPPQLLPQLLLLPNFFSSYFLTSIPPSTQCPSDKTDLTVRQDPGDSTDDCPPLQCLVALCSHTNLPPTLPGQITIEYLTSCH